MHEPASAPSHRRRRGNALPRAQSYKLDIHLPGVDACHISSAKTRKELKKTHPRKVLRDAQGRELLIHHNCCAKVGMHKFCCCCGGKCSCSEDDAGSGGGEIPSEFGGYGSGVVLWFRYLSCMFFLFLGLSVLSIPSALIYSASTDWDDVKAESAVDGLWRFTPANLGEAASACSLSESSDATLEASCPAGTKVSRVETYYANLQGSCECPASQVPHGFECPDIIPRGSTTCTSGEYCFYEQDRRANFPSGSTVSVSPCCAPKLDSTNQPDFSSLDIRVVPGASECDYSAAMQYIASRVCIGTDECAVSTARYTTQPFIDLTFVSLVDEEGMDPAEAAADSDYCTEDQRQLGRQWALQNPQRRQELDVDVQGICATTLHTVLNDMGLGTSSGQSCDTSSHKLALATWCAAEDLDIAGYGEVSRTNAALTLSLFDFFVCLLMLYASYTLVSNETAFQMFYTQATPADYTVVIENLPPHDSIPELEKRLKSHIQEYLSICPPVYTDVPNDRVEIADINFGVDDQTLTAVKVEQGKAAQKLQKYVAELTALGLEWKDLRQSPLAQDIRGDLGYYYCPVSACGGYFGGWCYKQTDMIAAKIELLRNDMARRRKYIQSLQDGAKRSSFATRAYVTFEEEEGALRALEFFPDSYAYTLCCSDKESWMSTVADGRQVYSPLRCRRAEEPSDAIWEHQQSQSSCGALLINMIVFLLFVFAVIGAGGAILGIEIAKQNALAEFPNVDCSTMPDSSSKILAIKDEYYDVFGQRTGRSGRMGCYCFELLLNSTTQVKDVNEEPFPVPGSSWAATRYQSLVFNMSTSQTTGGSAGNSAKESGNPLPDDWTYKYTCKDWLSSFATVTGLTYGGSILIVTINAGMIFFVHFMVRLMELPTQTEEIHNRTVFLFVAQFINTGIITVLLNAQIDSGALRRVAIGQYGDFTGGWYREVGTSIMLTMILNIIAAQVPHIRDLFIRWFVRCQDRDCSCDRSVSLSASQVDYENLQMGPKMRLDELYAIAMNTTFVCFIFGGGLPLLMPVAMIFMGICYVMQLYMFTRVYKTPPQYDNRVAVSMSRIIPYAVVLHLLVSAWMFSQYDIFPEVQPTDAIGKLVEQSASSESAGAEAESVLAGITIQGVQLSQRLWRTHVVPLVSLAFLILLYMVLRFTLYAVITRCCNGLAKCCTGKDCSQQYEPEYLLNYFDALPLSTILSYVGPKAEKVPRAHMRHKLIAALQRRTKAVEEKSLTLAQAVQTMNHKQAIAQSLEMDHTSRIEMQANIRYQIEAYMQTEQRAGFGGAATLQHMHEDLEHVDRDIAAVQADLDEAREDARRALEVVTKKRVESRKRSTVSFISTEVDGEKVEGMFVEDDESDAKIMQETHELSYCLDESVVYSRKFGYDVSSTIKDPELLQDFYSVLPKRSDGMSSTMGEGQSDSKAQTAMRQAIAESRLEQASLANVGYGAGGGHSAESVAVDVGAGPDGPYRGGQPVWEGQGRGAADRQHFDQRQQRLQQQQQQQIGGHGMGRQDYSKHGTPQRPGYPTGSPAPRQQRASGRTPVLPVMHEAAEDSFEARLDFSQASPMVQVRGAFATGTPTAGNTGHRPRGAPLQQQQAAQGVKGRYQASGGAAYRGADQVVQLANGNVIRISPSRGGVQQPQQQTIRLG